MGPHPPHTVSVCYPEGPTYFHAEPWKGTLAMAMSNTRVRLPFVFMQLQLGQPEFAVSPARVCSQFMCLCLVLGGRGRWLWGAGVVL
jgi:hypothetical protein